MTNFKIHYSQYIDFTKGIKRFVSSLKFVKGEIVTINAIDYMIVDSELIRLSTHTNSKAFTCNIVQLVEDGNKNELMTKVVRAKSLPVLGDEIGVKDMTRFLQFLFRAERCTGVVVHLHYNSYQVKRV